MVFIELENIKNEILKYLGEEHLKNLHEPSFYEVLSTLMNFVEESTYGQKVRQEKLAWVCNSVMGSGKTTAIKVLLKYLASNNVEYPLLLVFNEVNLMGEVYEEVNSYAKENGIRNLIEYVDSSNVNDVAQTLTSFQFVCITHQRLRDLTLGFGNWNEYRVFIKGHKPMERYINRSIIVDEMPILVDTAAFDVSSKDNSVDWFDKLAEVSNISAEERQFSRTYIMNLMSYEMLKSKDKRKFTKSLVNEAETTEQEKIFESVIHKLNTENGDYESIRMLRWFKKLLHTDRVGAIDRHSTGISVLCAALIPYQEKGNLIILDGTAELNKEIYKKSGYEIKYLQNYHDYKKRLQFHVRDINTTSTARSNIGSEVHGKIASDLQKIRLEVIDPIFPLSSKGDIYKYINNRVIEESQRKFYEENKKESGILPINLLNTKGKNFLSNYKSLALLNLPIRNPQYYKLLGIGVYGVDLDLQQYEKNDKRESSLAWFKDERLQKIYEGAFLSDTLQIIHRTELRNIKEQSEIRIYFYTHVKDWVVKLKEYLDLPDASVHYALADDKYNFLAKSKEYASKTKAFLEKNTDLLNIKAFTAGQIIKGEKFKKFINSNWSDSFKRNKITEIFLGLNIEIIVDEKKGKLHKKFRLLDAGPLKN